MDFADAARFSSCEVALVVPPFADVFQANLACHLLQACAKDAGFDVKIIYGNMLFASMVGPRVYRELITERLALEAVFRRAAFGAFDTDLDRRLAKSEAFQKADACVSPWLDAISAIVGQMAPRIVGASCSFEQITSSIALLKRCKHDFPDIVTLIGGANCEADMAEGLLSTGARIDHVASGESEDTFITLLRQILREGTVPDRIIYGKPCMKMNALPLPDYHAFFDQHALFLAGKDGAIQEPALPHESSRGCWWGEKHHCTFCGLNGGGMAFREKSADRIVSEIETLFECYPIKQLNMTDNIMPHRYFQTVLPRLASSLPPDVTIFYEQKANISLDKALLLRDAHITEIQPGIESLNTDLLTRMNKGTTAALNLRLLRLARILKIDVSWNLLVGFPGDRAESYTEMLQLMRKIPHLQPPSDFAFLRLDRFSPYHENPAHFGIENLRPQEIYRQLFPPQTDIDKLAYYFSGDYQSGAFECPDTIEQIKAEAKTWHDRWQKRGKPALSLAHLADDLYALVDTRFEGRGTPLEIISTQTAQAVMNPADRMSASTRDWLLQRDIVAELDGALVPLATAPVALLQRFSRPAENQTHADLDAQLPAE
ncbi:RiPP maturation radical SAM C-methyltransferase [Hoeflea ulvae]|uniref:RiPP maturation radical SAM C-methyltransferase n=1 Tax=Hoeflea ulvae TaxID=2983764 RepID=A0ABT3YKP4_9HYPH|nr:RiPP maturation radical SAM C-methyltransferase [Hoeflea ulvae]MCY0096408.1 RiPP maturation radical SAM C-methyltransferase [Hoeflea ulvae]